MAIATECPHCHKAYRLKDELAGKRANCTGCRMQFVVPAASTAPAAPGGNGVAAAVQPALDADALAVAALSDEPPPKAVVEAAQVEAATIKVKCPHCDHESAFEARMAGKNAPCQNDECRKIIKVPVPVKEEAKDWRTVKAKPTLARVDTDNIEGAWGNVQSTAVSRDALKEAEAIGGPDVAEPMSWTRRISYGMAALAALLLVGVGIRWFVRHRSAGQQNDTMALALEYAEQKPDAKKKVEKLKPELAGLIYLLAARLDAHNGKAKESHARLALARGRLAGTAPEQALAQIEIMENLAELIGTPAEALKGGKLEWDKGKIHPDIRQILTNFKSIPGEDGRDLRAMAIRGLTRKFEKRHQLQLPEVVAGSLAEEMSETLAVSGLELLALGQRDEAEQLANKASAGNPEGSPSLIALWLGLALQDAPADKKQQAAEKARAVAPLPTETPQPVARIGYAEGFARQGNVEAARKLAWSNGKPEDRLRAGVAVAAVVIGAKQDDGKDLSACAELVEKEFGDKKGPPWLLYRLVGLSLKAGKPELAAKFATAIGDAGLRAWSNYDILRARLRDAEEHKQPPSDEWAKEVGDPDRLAYSLGWAALARTKARVSSPGGAEKEVKGWDKESLRPFGFAGVALSGVPD